MENLSQKIINKIKQEGIEPTPKWEFVLKNTFFWGAFGLSVIIGGMAFSIIFHTLLNNDWDLYMQLSGGLTKFIVVTLPYFWLILFALFVVVAYLNIKNTKKAYKYSLQILVGGVLLASFLLGITFYNLGLTSIIDKNLIQKLPARYHSMVDVSYNLWQRPAEGFLSGTVSSVEGNILSLKDNNGEIWKIKLSEQILEIIPDFMLEQGFKLKMIGEEIKEDCLGKCFLAESLRPFERNHMKKGNSVDKELLEKMNLQMRKIQPLMEGNIYKGFRRKEN